MAIRSSSSSIDIRRNSERTEAILNRLNIAGSVERTAYREIYPESAMEAAAASDRRLERGAPLSPIDGKIFSVKDNFDVAGSVTLAGAAVRASEPPATQDADAVRLLKEAGAILIGRTVMSEFAFSGVGNNPHHGSPGNPRDRTRIAGGSSSGAAASIADETADIALGTDTGGSLRIPAALSGVVGFKPSSGVVSTRGIFPLSTTLDVAGPICRTVAECAEAFKILSGQGPCQPPEIPKPLCIGVVNSQRLLSQMDQPVLEAFDRTVELLASNGVKTSPINLDPLLDDIARLNDLGTFPSIELAANLAELGADKWKEIDQRIRSRIEPGRPVSSSTYIEMRKILSGIRKSVVDMVAGYDAIVLPTVPIIAPKYSDIDEPLHFSSVNALLLRNPIIFNIADMPAISIPMKSDEFPLGIMVTGRSASDLELLDVASRIEEVISIN